jgi:hypothetical protein
MAEVTIKDTGKLYVGASVISGEKIASGDSGVTGAELTLKNASLSYNLETFTNTPNQPLMTINNTSTEAFTYGDSVTTGILPPDWTLSIYINTSVVADMITYGRLVYMCQTKGYKELYSSTDNGFYDLIAYSKYGLNEAAGLGTKTVEYINVRIKNMQVTQTADKKGVKITLHLVEV